MRTRLEIVAENASPTLRGAPEAVRQYFWVCPGVNNIRRVQFEAWERLFAHFICGKKTTAAKKKVSLIRKSASEQDDVVNSRELWHWNRLGAPREDTLWNTKKQNRYDGKMMLWRFRITTWHRRIDTVMTYDDSGHVGTIDTSLGSVWARS